MIPVTRTGNAAHDMSAVMARVRKMSDSQLADVLAGKDVSVPQFAAMTEAMGRKQLRQAVDGAQAQQQAKQPSVKDQLLAEQAGLASLPAPNMEDLGEGMAGGGIVAFANTGVVGNSKVKDAWEALQTYDPGAMTKGEGLGSDITNFFSRSFDSDRKIDPETGKPISFKEFLDKQERKDIAAAPAVAPVTPAAPAAPVAPAASPAAPAAASEPKKERLKLSEEKEPAKDAGIAALADRKDYLGKYEGAGARMREGIGALKEGKQSDILLGAAEALLSSPTLAQAASKAAGKTAQIGAAARKEEREINKAADEYEFNWAKAMEAASQGNQDLAYKYAALADQAKYRAGILGIKGQELSMHKDMYDMVKIPQQLSNIYAKATDAVKAATANRPVKPDEFRRLVDEEYRKRAAAVGLGKAVDTYSPSTSLTTVSQLPKGVSAMKLPDDA